MGKPPNRNQRLVSRRWKNQRERNRLIRELMPGVYMMCVELGLPLPGRPWWRVEWAKAGIKIIDLPMSRRPAAFQAAQTNQRRRHRQLERKRQGLRPWERRPR